MKNQFLLYAGIIMLTIASACKKSKGPETDPTPVIPVEEAKIDETIPAIIPHIYIQIENNAEVVVKADYLNATVEINGFDKFPKLEVTNTQIKGRGNSTWTKPKKPYRLKLNSKASILGLPAAKNWILLANYNDYTLMTNAVAMKIGQYLGMPYTNNIIPVDLTVNGVYRGNYNLTQQIEIDKDRINVGKDGAVLEFDSYFDEDFKFRSTHFNLPVMVKDADVSTPELFNALQKEFQDFENLVAASNFPNNEYAQQFDKLQFANFLIANNLAMNLEANHPKSVYMHKKKGGKYTMGPIWDFDWGFGFDEITRRYFHYEDIPFLNDRIGGKFFAHLLKDPEIRSLYKQQWAVFKEKHFENLLKYVEEYAATIRESQKKDFDLWKVGPNNMPQAKADMKTYLRKRVLYIDKYLSTLK